MKQPILAMVAKYETGFEQHRRPTRRDEFLGTMNRIISWADLCAVIEPHYPKRGNGRPPIGLERMLRLHFIPHWFNLADFACEEALYDITSLRHFAGIDLGCEAVPDATTLLKFRLLLETCMTNIPCLICCMAMSSALYGDSVYASQKDLIHSI